MALKTYTPDGNKIVHTTGVDFNNRSKFFRPVYVVQYDDQMPVLAISLYNNGEEYVLPSSADATIRVGKPGRKFVEREALGCSQDRKILYFEITLQMVTDWGKLYPIITITVNGAVAGSSPILLVVEKNPIQEGDIESTTDFKTLTGYVEDAKQYADSAKQSEQTSTQNAEATEEAKTQSKTNADNAKTYSESAQESAREAAASAESIKGSEETVTQLRTETETWAKKAESFAHGETDIRPEEATDNAKYYKEQAQAIANSITNVLRPKGNIEFAQLKLLESPKVGDFYNVTDAFTSDSTFLDGPDIHYPEGSDVYWTDTNKWNVVQGSGVSGIKGKAESVYRKGQVEIDKDDIGLDQVDNTPDAKKNVASAGKVTNKLTVGAKTYDGSEAIEIIKDDLGLSNVENKSAETILSEMTKQNVVDALEYEPPVDDTQGINLLTGTKDFSGEWILYKDDCVKDGTYKNLDVYRHSQAWSGVTQRIDVLGGETYTFSAYVKSDAPVSFVLAANMTDFAETNPTSASFDTTTDWKRYVFSFKVTKSGKLNPRVQMPSGETNIYVCGYKLEKGTVTDPQWTPAPEDLLLKGEVDGRNLFVMGDSEPGTMNGFDGKVVVGYFADRTCDYISVHEGEQISIRSIGTAPINIDRTYYIMAVWFDSGKNHISYVDHYQKQSALTEPTHYDESFTITAPPNAAYLRVSARFYDDGKIKVERGSIATDWTPAPEDVVTKTPPDIFDALDSIPEMHRNIFRGKNLGTVFTDEQKANIKNGTFHDLWVGDYWVINNHTWRIVDINYWYNKGDQNCTTPHIVVMPDAILYSHKMNNDNVTTGGYYGSLMYTEGLTRAKEIVNTDFGEGFVLNHRVLLTNKVDSGHASAGTWYDSTVELANEIMMYGCLVFSAMNNGTAVPYSYTTEYTQLALFRLVPRFINALRQWFWLRDVVSATVFATVGTSGLTAYGTASNVGGVRPVVGITGGNEISALLRGKNEELLT